MIFVLIMSLQAGKELPDVAEVGTPPECIPQKIEPVIHSTNVGSKARIVTLDVTRSLRDRGKEKSEDRAVISYIKVDSRSQRSGRSGWMHVFPLTRLFVIEDVSLSIDGIPSADLVEDYDKALTYMVSHTKERGIVMLFGPF